MTSFDPRHWYLAAIPASLVACGPPGIPAFDEDVGDDATDDSPDVTDSPTSDEWTDSSDGEEAPPPECYSDADCPYGYYCLNGSCEYYGCLDWCEEDDAWYECYSDYECPPGYSCVYNECQGIPTPFYCEPPEFEELAVPDLGGPVLELSFVDVDGDGDDELVALRSIGVVTLMDDDSVVTSTWPAPVVEPFAGLVALDLEATGPRDIAVFSGQDGGVAWLGTGDGAGGFSFNDVITGFPTISGARAIDPELDGVDTLAAIVDGTGVLFDDVAGLVPDFQMLQADVTEIHPGQLDVDLPGSPDLLLARGCLAGIDFGPDLEGDQLVLADNPVDAPECSWRVGDFVQTNQQPVALLQAFQSTYVEYWSGELFEADHVMLPDFFGPMEVLDIGEDQNPRLLLANTEVVGLLWNWHDFPSSCFATLPISGTTALAVGDRSGDGRQEFATLDSQGGVRLFQLP